jgi:tetratricopeptide (TPR) repeat protein
MFRPVTSVLFLLISFLSTANAAQQWVEVRSGHFTVLTNTNEKQGREIATRFEQMRAVFGSLFHKTRVNLPTPLQIVALRNQSEMRRFAPVWKGKPVEVAGFFQGADDRNFILIDMASPDPYAVVFHEYAHLLLNGNFPALPAWFDEGFAEYFSSLKINDKQVQYGDVPKRTQYTLANSKWMPLADLLATQHDSPVYNERDKSGIFYAQSWLVVHYLMSNEKVLEAAKYLQLTQIEKRPIPEAVKVAFGMDLPMFEKTMVNYFHGTGRMYTAPASSVDAGPYVVKKVDDLTARAMLADVLAHSSNHHQEAIPEFEAILQQDPKNLLANRGLGYLYLRNNDFEKAEGLFRRASADDPNDARLHYLVALLMNRKALKEGHPPENPTAMRRELERAIELDPTLADAYNLLAFALSAEQKFEAAITAQKKAIDLYPSKEMYQANLAGIYLHAQRWDDAEAVLARLKESSDPKIREVASQNLAGLQASKELASQSTRARELARNDITAPQWRRKEGSASSPAEAEDAGQKPDTRKVLYMYGRLQSVDCSGDPVAIMNVRSGAKLMKLRTDNYKKLLLMGADEFSCDWRDRKVLVNYKPGGKADGDVVTLELQASK